MLHDRFTDGCCFNPFPLHLRHVSAYFLNSFHDVLSKSVSSPFHSAFNTPKVINASVALMVSSVLGV